MLEREIELNKIKFICPNNNSQIIEEISLSEMKNHIENCKYKKLYKCIQCNSTGSENELIDHIKICNEAMILCDFCNEETERKYYNIHLNNCEKKDNINETIRDSINNEEISRKKLEQDYDFLTKNKIDNLSKDDFLVYSEKNEEINIIKKSKNNEEIYVESNIYLIILSLFHNNYLILL